jgi:hypothetical protein
MERQPVTSSSSSSIGHDGDVLEVEFTAARSIGTRAFPATTTPR